MAMNNGIYYKRFILFQNFNKYSDNLDIVLTIKLLDLWIYEVTI